MRAVDLDRYQGRWVALDRSTDAARADASDLADLHRLIKEGDLDGIVVQRVPAKDEPLFIGLA